MLVSTITDRQCAVIEHLFLLQSFLPSASESFGYSRISPFVSRRFIDLRTRSFANIATRLCYSFFTARTPSRFFFLLCFGTRQVKLVVAFLLYSLLFFRLRVTCSFFSIDRQCFYCHGGCELFLAFEQSKPNHLCKN